MGINIGGKLRSLRQKNNLTQKELADRCELSKGFISQLESKIKELVQAMALEEKKYEEEKH